MSVRCLLMLACICPMQWLPAVIDGSLPGRPILRSTCWPRHSAPASKPLTDWLSWAPADAERQGSRYWHYSANEMGICDTSAGGGLVGHGCEMEVNCAWVAAVT
jgi:hypothetical protein